MRWQHCRQRPENCILSARRTNDLHQVLVANKVKFDGHDKAGAAVAAATPGAAVMILADGYPAEDDADRSGGV